MLLAQILQVKSDVGARIDIQILLDWGMRTGLILAGVVFFVLFLAYKSLFPLFLSPDRRDARRRMLEAKKRARNKGLSQSEAAAAWREASEIAFEEMEQPNRAASYARRADFLDPSHQESISLVAKAMHRAGRRRGLEKLLWRKLSQAIANDSNGPRARRIFGELLKLYQGGFAPQREILERLWRESGRSLDID